MAIAPQRTATGAPSVRVEPGAHATAGQVATLHVHVRNVTAAPQDVLLRVIGLEGGWLPAPVTVSALPAGATASVEVPLSPPAGSAPGDYPCVVAVEARTGAVAATTLADASLRVDGTSDLVLSVEPADSRAVRARRIQVVLANTGDSPADVRIEGRADDERDLRVDLSAAVLRVDPHETVRLPGRVRTARPRLVGPRRRVPFRVTATGARAPQRFDATVTLRPLLTPAAARALAVVLVVALWVGGVLAALPWLSDRFDPSRQTVVAEQEESPGPGTEPGSGAEPGSEPGDGAGGAPGAEPDERPGDGTEPGSEPGGAALGVRVAGVVTGAEPGGVRVQVVPAAALEDGGSAGTGTGAAALAPVSRTPADGTGTAGTRLGDLLHGLAALTSPAVLTRTVVPALLGTGAGAAVRDEPAQGPVGKVSGLALPVERSDEASQRRSTVTTDDGTWAFGGLSATGRYLVVLSKPGYQTQRFLVTGAEAAAAPLELEMVPGEGRMSGTVTGPDGPVGGVEVTLSDGTTTVTTRTATAGDVGRWEVEGLSSPSTYLVSAGSDRLGTQSTLVRLAAAGERTVDLTLTEGVAALSGTVRGVDSLGGVGGLGGLTVTATAGDTVRTATTVTGDRAGTFVLPDLPVPASYTLTVSGEGYASQTSRIDLGPGGTGPLDITMTSTGGVVEGGTTDETGEGIAGAGLTLTGPSGVYKTMSASDADGSFRFSGIAPGDYVLTAEAFGHEPTSAQVTVVSGGSATVALTLPTIPGDGLTASAFVRGRVTDAGTGGQVTCPGLQDDETCQVTVSTTVTAPDGSSRQVRVTSEPDLPYLLPAAGSDGLFPGRYTLTVTVPGYEPGTVQVAVSMGEVVEAATVALYPSPSIVGSVGTRVGPLPAGTCVLALPTGSPAPGTDPCAPASSDPTACASDSGRCAYVGVNGGYTIERLRAGSYTVYVLPPDGSTYLAATPGTVTLTPGDVRRFDATLDRLGVLSLTVLGSDGSGSVLPAGRAQVSVTPVSGGGPVPDVQTDENGFVQVTGLRTGTYRVEAQAAGSPATGTLTAVSVAVNQEISAQLVLTGAVSTIDGTVVTQLNAAGQDPVGGATVSVTGVVGYRGVTPITQSVEVTTDTDGGFLVCTQGTVCDDDADPSTGTLPLVEGRVDVRVTHDDYQTYVANGVAAADVALVVLSPRGVPFTGKVTLNPAPDPDDATGLYDDIVFSVTEAPPGTGEISLKAGAGGAITWFDSAQPLGTGADAPRLVRPGHYRVSAALAGYNADAVVFDVLPGAPSPVLELALDRYGYLRVQLVTDQDADVPVVGGVVTLTLQNGGTQRLEAHPGNSYVDFGELPSGTYSLEARAPGYAARTTTVPLVAGQAVTAPSQVRLTRLGTAVGTVKTRLLAADPDAGITADWTQNLPGAQVTVRSRATGQEFSGITDGTGTFRITGDTSTSGLAPGVWDVEATEPVGHLGTATGDVPIPVPDVTDVADLNVEVEDPLLLAPVPRSLLVTVVDDRVPVGGLSLRLRYSDGNIEHDQTVEPVCAGGCPDDGEGTYRFSGLLPLTYNLTITGPTYAPLVLPVTIGTVQDSAITVPITQPAGSVQGVVRLQQAGGGTVPAGGAEVTLSTGSDEDETVVATTTAEETTGAYRFASVAAGTYTLTAADEGTGLVTSRSVVVQSAQGVVVDLLLQPTTRQVAVTVTSSNHTDLSGALVRLTRTGEALGAQPVVRSAADTYTTTFSQVPVGEWDVTLSGPAGHLGTYTTSVEVADDGETTAVEAGLTVAERQLRLRAASTESGAPSSVQVELTPDGGTATTVVAVLGGGDTVVHVPADEDVEVSATVTGDWVVDVDPETVEADDAVAVVTLTVSPQVQDTQTTLTADRTTVELGDLVTFTAAVAREGETGTVTGGTLVLQRLVDGDWEDVRSWTANGAERTHTVDTADWGVGEQRLRASYGGAASWAASTSDEVTVTVEEIETETTLEYDEGVLTATVTPTGAQGSVTFRDVTDPDDPQPLCTGVDVEEDGTATCAPEDLPSGTRTLMASFSGTDGYADSQDELEVEVEAAPDPGGTGPGETDPGETDPGGDPGGEEETGP